MIVYNEKWIIYFVGEAGLKMAKIEPWTYLPLVFLDTGSSRSFVRRRIVKSVNFVGQVEGTGTVRGVSLETLFKIAQVLKIPPSKLLEDDWSTATQPEQKKNGSANLG